MDLCHSQKIKTINNNINDINNNIDKENESEDELNIIKVNSFNFKNNKKAHTYIPKNRNNLNIELEKEEYPNENNNKNIKNEILNLLNNININNLNSISEKIIDLILDIKNTEQFKENEIIFIVIIFDKVYNDKTIISIYFELCKKINSFLLNINKNNKNNTYQNEEYNLINNIVKEFYRKINIRNYLDNINIENEKTIKNIENKFLGLFNFISVLILNKLIKEEAAIIITKLFNEYEYYENSIKFIFLKGIIIIMENLLNVLDYSNKTENLTIVENIIYTKLKKMIIDKNISDNLKNKLNNIIQKFNEFKQLEQNNNNNNNSNKNFIDTEKDNCENINLINNNIKNNNNIVQDENENGGIQINIEDEKNNEEISFKIDKNDKNKNHKIEFNKENNIFLNKINNNTCNNSTNKLKLDNNNEKCKNITNIKENASNINQKRKLKSKNKIDDKILKYEESEKNEILFNEKEKNIYNKILEDIENYFEFLNIKGIKSKKDFYIDINYSYNWKIIDDLIMTKKVKLDEIIKIIIEIIKNKNDIDSNDIFKINEYIKTIIEYYSNDLSNNQLNIFRLNMIEIYMAIDEIIKNFQNPEIMYEILGNLLFILLKNKLYYIKDLNNFIDKSEDTQIKICKIVKYAIISSGSYSKQYINDFKYTKLFNNNDLFVNNVINELSDNYKK